MVTKIYAVYDHKAEAFLQPFFAKNDAVAERMFSAAVMDDEHQFCKHAEDYTLWTLGVFDEESGVLHSTGPKTMLRAFDIVRRHKPATVSELARGA